MQDKATKFIFEIFQISVVVFVLIWCNTVLLNYIGVNSIILVDLTVSEIFYLTNHCIVILTILAAALMLIIVYAIKSHRWSLP